MFQPLQGVTSHRLPNGLAVLLKETHGWPLVSVQAWVRVGSVDESDSEAGLAHVLEHMVFKGTAHHNAAEISRWVEAHGGALNAETSKEYTHYYIDLPSSATSRAIHLMAELLARARLGAGDWRNECPVILEEMKRRHDDAETAAWELLQEAIYADTPHARPVIGSPESVSSLSADDVRRFYEAHYTVSNTLIVVVGDFKTADVLRQLRQELKSMPRGSPRPARPESIPQAAGQVRRVKKPVQQVYAIYGFPTPPADHADQEALDLLAVLLGDGRNARLVHTLREEKELVWSVGASNITQESPGIFAIFTEANAQKSPAVKPAVRAVLRNLLQRPPSAEEIRRAKNLIQTSWLQGYETFHAQASVLGSYALEGHLDRLKSYLPKVLSLRAQDLAPVIKKYFSQELCSAVVGP